MQLLEQKTEKDAAFQLPSRTIISPWPLALRSK